MIKSLFALMISFGKIGFTSLGGGHSMLKLIEFEAVASRHWLDKEAFTTMLGSTFLFPGLTAVKLSALIGYQVAGILGLITAVLCLNTPGLLMALVGYRFLASSESVIIKKLVIIVQYGALALLASATFSIADGVFKSHFSIMLLALTLIFFICMAVFKISPFWGLITYILIAFTLLTIQANF